jgi:arylsulfatase A-like enzyme
MIDTLRADHLSCYGGAVATPAICSLASDGGAIFDGFSHASWTKPATATLLTGLLPKSHAAMSKTAALADSLELLPELLHKRGYSTGGVVSNINLAESFGFRQGYDEYHYLAPDYLLGAEESSSKLVLYSILRAAWFKLQRGYRVGDFYQDSGTVNDAALDFLERQKSSRFFLFVHYMDPHDPYFEHPYNGHAIARVSNQHPDPALADEMRRLYAGEVAHVDAAVGKLIEKLRALGIYDNTAIALVADHGEEFHEHGGFWHGLTLYDEQIRVPLLLKWPRGEALASGDQRGWPAGLIDVAPTLLARAGVAAPSAMPGRDLGSMPPSARVESERIVFAEEDHEGNVLRALRSRDWKWIEANASNPRGLPPEQLFEVSRDPEERNDLRESQPARIAALREQAVALEQRAGELTPSDGGSAELSDAQKSALESLGYLE